MHIKYLAQSLAPSTEPIIFFLPWVQNDHIWREIQAFNPSNQIQTILCLDYFTLSEGQLPGIWKLRCPSGNARAFWSQDTNDLSINKSRDRPFNFLLNADHKRGRDIWVKMYWWFYWLWRLWNSFGSNSLGLVPHCISSAPGLGGRYLNLEQYPAFFLTLKILKALCLCL